MRSSGAHALLESPAARAAVAAVLAFIGAAGVAIGGPLSEPGYRVERFAHPAGGPVAVHVALSEPALVTVTAHDANHVPVATVAAGELRPAGDVNFSWNGQTDTGEAAPRGAYYFVIEASGESGWERHDPALDTGGEPLVFGPGEQLHDRKRGEIVFTLRRPAWVVARAGVRDGPQLAAPIDWQPFDAGQHRVAWNGKDDSGLLELAALPRQALLVEAFALPRGSIALDGPAPSKRPAPAGKASIRRAQIAKAAAARGADPRWMEPQHHRTSPGFTISVRPPEAAKSASGAVALALEVSADEATRTRLLEQRFEIVTFVDYRRVAEEEQGYLPYSLELPKQILPPGAHTVSVSIVTFSGQGATRSVKLGGSP